MVLVIVRAMTESAVALGSITEREGGGGRGAKLTVEAFFWHVRRCKKHCNLQ